MYEQGHIVCEVTLVRDNADVVDVHAYWYRGASPRTHGDAVQPVKHHVMFKRYRGRLDDRDSDVASLW